MTPFLKSVEPPKLTIGTNYNPRNLFVGTYLPNWILKREDLTFADKIIWAKLAQHSSDTGECFPSMRTLAEEVGANLLTIQRSIDRLCKIGLIKKTNPQGWEKLAHRNASYQFLVDEALIQEFETPAYTKSTRRGVQKDIPNISNTYIINKEPILRIGETPVSDTSKEKRIEKTQAVMVYRSITHLYPNVAQEEEINKVVQPNELPKWQEIIKEWLLRGYNKTNVKGMLEWFQNGIPQAYKSKAKWNPEDTISQEFKASPNKYAKLPEYTAKDLKKGEIITK